MGQGVSSIDGGGNSSSLLSLGSNLQGEVVKQTACIRELASLSYDEFTKDILELNTICKNLTDSNGNHLVFAIRKGTDSSLLWKGTVRIACVKVESETGKIESYRLLNLKTFLQIKKNIIYQAGNGGIAAYDTQPMMDESEGAACSSHPDLTASLIFTKIDALDCKMTLDECCICMERKPDVILPCTHSYCLPCIEQWNVTHKTCPICRETLDSTDESWIISEKPDSAEVAAELRQCLIQLADQSPSSSTT